MNICICTNTRPHEGGMTAYIDTIARGLRGRGHRVDVLTLSGVSGKRRTWNRMVRVSDRVLQGRQHLTIAAYRFSEAVLTLILLFYGHRRRYDVFFAVDDSAADICVRLFGATSVPVVHGVHSSLTGDLMNQNKIRKDSAAFLFFDSLQKRAYRNPDGLAANSAYMAGIIRTMAPDHAPLRIIANPVDADLFSPRPSSPEHPGIAFTLFCPGQLIERKGVLTALDAFERLAREKDDFRIVFAGDGPLKEELVRRQRSGDFRDRVVLTGPVPHRNMGDLYRASDCVLAPSITLNGLAEPQGLTVLEAMACGIPVIASDMGGFREAVRHGFNGLLVPENDPEALARSVMAIRNDEPLRRKLTQNGLDTIRRGFTPDASARELEGFFQERRSKKQAGAGP